jgi:hypothetical protein
MWENAKEVSFKHSQMIIILGVGVLNCSNFWNKNENNKPYPN